MLEVGVVLEVGVLSTDGSLLGGVGVPSSSLSSSTLDSSTGWLFSSVLSLVFSSVCSSGIESPFGVSLRLLVAAAIAASIAALVISLQQWGHLLTEQAAGVSAEY